MQIEYVSASRGNLYIDCPFRYFLQYHLRMPELNKDTIHTHKGSAVHEALEYFVKEDRPVLDYLKEYYAKHKVWTYDDRKPNRGFPHPVEKMCAGCKWAKYDGSSVVCSIANEDVKNFEGCPKPNFEDDLALAEETAYGESSPLRGKILEAEAAFDITFGDIRTHGFIDLIVELDEDTIEVIDYKTGNWTKNTDEAFKDLQMRMYSVAAKILYPKYKYAVMTLAYLRKKPISVIFSEEDDAKTIEFVKMLGSKIKESVDPPRKKSFKCSWCVGYEECGKIRESYLDKDGNFNLPPPVKSKRKGRKLPSVTEEGEL